MRAPASSPARIGGPSGTHLRHISWSRGTTFVRCRSYWATGCSDHDDLYPRVEPRAGECKESFGHARGFHRGLARRPTETLCSAKAH